MSIEKCLPNFDPKITSTKNNIINIDIFELLII